ncbi:MAG: AMP-binding protein [Thermodesulfobacteriota bacterium]
MEQLQDSSDALSIKLASHAASNVPYYRKTFQRLGLDPTTMKLPGDWDRLPVLDKDILRREYENLISNSKDNQQSFVNHSGGSTGKPVLFITDNTLYARMSAWMDFVFGWAGWQPGELRLELWGNQERELPPTPWERWRASLAGSFAIPVYNYTEKDMFQWWQVVQKQRPTIIYGYSSVLADFAKWLESESCRPHGIKGIFSSAEVLYPAQRSIIERVFGCKVYNQYGSRETPCVASECPEGGMHLFIDWNRVEFLPPEDSNSENSDIIITPLYNYAQPLLRYRIGDLGRPKAESCACGRGYPLMQVNVARSRDFLYGTDGTKFYPGFFTRLMDGKDWVQAFQFVQTAETEIVLHVVPEAAQGSESLSAALQAELGAVLRQKIGAELQFLVRVVESIDRTGAGKHRYVINEIQSARVGR